MDIASTPMMDIEDALRLSDETRKNTNTGDITIDDLSELDLSIHNHRAEVLGSVDWQSMMPGLVLTVYQLYSIATESDEKE